MSLCVGVEEGVDEEDDADWLLLLMAFISPSHWMLVREVFNLLSPAT